MSTTAPERPVYRPCDRAECDESYRPPTGTEGYCSDACWALVTAGRLLTIVYNDHKHCASCFRRLRTVIPPGRAANSRDKFKDVPECAIGWAIPEPETTTVDGEVFSLEQTATGLETRLAGGLTRRQGCSCGTTHHATIERSTLPTDEAINHANRLADTLTSLREDGVHDHEFDRDILLDAVRAYKQRRDEQGDDGLIFRKAVGAALLAERRCSDE